ncbi:D-alanyl-D-alanine carboxypeptidase [Streptomyces sp. BK208]|uniref:D-alanyl-D-alanine carboxypeptidase n=1 Tax=Streptomyces sp. BK208 TaxID=2512150 RepID=UPI00105F9553|nr:D-alanyl-D-alanine carboxypeptidase [Streptomyces sp. BK208]TDT32300.1 D-alanyl-D-alanine carboxypeptidase [Streptomyces sp. BK208]
MEEASVAGESPDRSKQRESSEEPTSGSAGPVPEARTEASEHRDPRLGAAREDAKRSAGGTGSRGGVDTATRVLSARGSAPEADAADGAADDEASGTSDGSGAPEASGTPGADREKPAATNEGRLRDVVAAWVATADERAAANARLEGGEGASAGADAPEGQSEGQKAAPAEDGDNGEPGPRQGAEESEAATADATGSDAEAEAGTPSASGPDTGAGAGAGADAAFGSGSATDSASGPGRDAASRSDAAGGSDPDSAAGTDTGTASRRDAGSGSGTGAAGGSDPDTGVGSGSRSDAATGTDSGSDTGADDRSDAATGSKTVTTTGSGAGTGADVTSRPDSGSDTGAPTGRDSASGAKASAGSGSGPASGAGKGPAADADSGASAGSGAASASDEDDGEGEGDGGGEPPVDQPTAVFKAPRPAVDQPTTMLKLGDAASAAGRTGPSAAGKTGPGAAGKTGPGAAGKTGPGAAGKADPGAAERTSKFVALRNPDDPATRRPPQAPQATKSPEAAPEEAPAAARTPRTGVTAPVSHVGPDRTTQQPLPPKPPLDLLAELTNTPPPPETPLRTTVRRVKIWTPLVILLVIIIGVVQSMRPLPAPTLDLTAQDSFTFEGGKPEIPWPSSGQAALDVQGIGTFGSSGDQKPVPIASVAKVMTAYVILRDHPLKSGAEGPKIKIDQAAEEQSEAGDESTVHVYAGDSISQREALKAILIASANNVARLLARWDSGSEKGFVEKMNAAAKDLGMTNTTYTDPSGLNNTTVSTAVDQVKLAKEAMKEPAFREVATMMSYDDYKGANHGNWNQLVGHNGVVGIKTGTTTSALGNLVFAAKKEVGGETRTIVGAVVRQPATADKGILAAALDAGDQLIRAAQGTLKSSTIIEKGSVVGYVDDGLGGRTPVVATQDVKAVGWGGLTVKLTFDADEVPHTAKAGTKVGTLTVGDGGTSGAVKVPVALRDDLAEPGFSDKLTRLG